MRHKRFNRLVSGALSAAMIATSLPTPALAEAAHALSAQGVGIWQHDAGVWTYQLPGGALATGWQDVDGTWYLFGGDGAMLTGWQKVGDTYYYLGSSGGMYSARWLLEGETWYYLLPSGAMATGWAFVNGVWYYFYPASGAMARDTEVDGCWLRGDGAWDDGARVPRPNAVIAQLTAAQDVDPLATETVVRVESDLPFAQDLSASTIALGADWENASVTSVRRDGACAAYVTVSGLAYDAAVGREYTGAISFRAGSFADASAEGVAGVRVAHQAATLQNTENSFVDDAFVLSVSLGSAQLPSANDASAFSLPANPGIQVASATNLAYGNTAAITVKAPGSTPYEQFRALDDALTQSGVQVSGTTAGTQAASFDATNRTSALSYTQPQLTAYLERGYDGKGWKLEEDGGASFQLVVRVVSTGGDPNLSQSSFRFTDEGLNELITGSSTPADAPYQRVFDLSHLSADELSALQDSYEVEDTAAFLDLYTYQLANRMAQGIEIAGGITNTWGIELPGDEYLDTAEYNLVGLGDTWNTAEDPQSDESGEQALETQANKSDAEQVSEAFKFSTEIIKAAGLLSAGIGTLKSQGGVFGVGLGNILNGAGSILGICGKIADMLTPTTWTLGDVMNQVLALDDRLDSISAQLGGITQQLDKLEKSVDYKTQVSTLTQLAQQGMAYRPWVTAAIDGLNTASDRDTYKLSQGDRTPTGKVLKTLYTQTQKQSSLTAYGKSAYQVAVELADAITGNSSTGLSGGARSFFDYTASCVNWEPETFYAREAFLCYIDCAFSMAYMAASNELLRQEFTTSDEATKAVIQTNYLNLMTKVKAVNELVGEEGSLTPRTKDRTDGTVLCTVNNRLYKKCNGQASDHPALVYPWANTSNSEFTSVFNDLLTSRDEDKEHDYHHQSTLSRADLETMAERQAYVRTVPGYGDITSIYNELNRMGLVTADAKDSGLNQDKTWEYGELQYINEHPMSYAIVGDPTRTDKNDAASRYHNRTYQADMYDIKSNKSVGKSTAYYYNVYYYLAPARWHVDLRLYSFIEFRAV